MSTDALSLWERVVYGPDGDDKPTRSFSTFSAHSAGNISPIREKHGSTVNATHKDILHESTSLDSESAKKSFPHLTNVSTSSSLPKPRSHRDAQKLAWRPNLFQPRAFAGFGGLCVTVCCVLASLAILVTSNKQPVDSWAIEPTVYLAIVAAVANSAVRLARFQAIPISWWYKASRGGTVRALERHWEINNSVIRAIFHSRHMSLLNIACLAGSFVIIDGPLLQRASTVVSATQSMDVTVNIPLPAELPTGFSGFYYQHILWENNTAAYMQMDYLHHEAIQLSTSGCEGKCEAQIKGPGVVKTNCSSQTWPITPASLSSFNATWGPWKSYYENSGDLLARLPIYYTSLEQDIGNVLTHEAAKLSVGLATWFDSKGDFVQTVCELRPAIVEYDITIEGHAISLPRQPGQGRFVAFVNNTKPESLKPAALKINQPSTIGSIPDVLAIFTNANASALLNQNTSPGVIYSPDPQTFNVNVLRHLNYSNGAYDLNFRDPTPDIIFDFNRLMLRAAAKSSNYTHLKSLVDPGVPTNQTVLAHQTVQRNIFKSDLRWYAGAAVFELVTVILILPMFWGWWTLGCHMTLSPFALALAFDSPILKGVNSAAGSRGVVKELGSMRLRFGEVVSDMPAVPDGEVPDGAATGRLGVAESHNVTRPRKGMQFCK